MLHFGSEVWGFHEATDIELIHIKFLRRILCVKKSTNLVALYGELGRLPLSIIRKLKIVKYWLKILNKNDKSHVKTIKVMLKEDTDHNRNYNNKNWAFQVKDMLHHLGLSFVWDQQVHIEIPYTYIKQRLIDGYL